MWWLSWNSNVTNVKETAYSSLQPISPLRNLSFHVRSCSVICHPTRWHSRFYPFYAGAQFSDPRGMQGWVDLVGWFIPKTVTHPSTNRARRRVTLLTRQMTLPLQQTIQRSRGYENCCGYMATVELPSVFWHCWLGGRKGIQPVKSWVLGC